MVEFLKYEFNNKLLDDVKLLIITPYVPYTICTLNPTLYTHVWVFFFGLICLLCLNKYLYMYLVYINLYIIFDTFRPSYILLLSLFKKRIKIHNNFTTFPN